MVFRPGLILEFRFALLAIAFATLVWLPGPNVHAQPTTKSPIPLPEPFTPIVDYASVIDPDTQRRLEAIYKNLKERADIEFAVVTVPTTGDRDIFEYSLDIARGWGIGSKEGEKNGFLLVVAVNDRKYFTQVSDHLEGDLPDGLVGQIQRERLVPQFRRGNYSQGIYDSIQAYVATLAEKRGFSIEGIDQSYAYREPREQPRLKPTRVSSSSCCTLGIIVFVIFIILLSMRRGGGSGCLNMFLLGSLLNSGGRGGWGGSSSGWSGGGFGGSGGGGGFGGGFGGGGSFGGGGAGGSW
ncbi:MAG: TPM domain-containing protein [Pyrinomonadaceae bacterium]